MRMASSPGDAVLDLKQFGRTCALFKVRLVTNPLTEEGFLVTGQLHGLVLVPHRYSPKKVLGFRAT